MRLSSLKVWSRAMDGGCWRAVASMFDWPVRKEDGTDCFLNFYELWTKAELGSPLPPNTAPAELLIVHALRSSPQEPGADCTG